MDSDVAALTQRCKIARKTLQDLVFREAGDLGHYNAQIESHCKTMTYYLEAALDALEHGYTEYESDLHDRESDALLLRKGTSIGEKLRTLEDMTAAFILPRHSSSRINSNIAQSSISSLSYGSREFEVLANATSGQSAPMPQTNEFVCLRAASESEDDDDDAEFAPEEIDAIHHKRHAASTVTKENAVVDVTPLASSNKLEQTAGFALDLDAVRIVDSTPKLVDQSLSSGILPTYAQIPPEISHLPIKASFVTAPEPDVQNPGPSTNLQGTIEDGNVLLNPPSKRSYEPEGHEEGPAQKRTRRVLVPKRKLLLTAEEGEDEELARPKKRDRGPEAHEGEPAPKRAQHACALKSTMPFIAEEEEEEEEGREDEAIIVNVRTVPASRKRGYEPEGREEEPAPKKARRILTPKRKLSIVIEDEAEDRDDDFVPQPASEESPPTSAKASRKFATPRGFTHPSTPAYVYTPFAKNTPRYPCRPQRPPRVHHLPCPEGVSQLSWEGMSLAGQQSRWNGIRWMEEYLDEYSSEESDDDSDVDAEW